MQPWWVMLLQCGWCSLLQQGRCRCLWMFEWFCRCTPLPSDRVVGLPYKRPGDMSMTARSCQPIISHLASTIRSSSAAALASTQGRRSKPGTRHSRIID